jgi:hypothetical protein
MKIQKLYFKAILAGLLATLVTARAAGMGMGGCMMGCTTSTISDRCAGLLSPTQ